MYSEAPESHHSPGTLKGNIKKGIIEDGVMNETKSADTEENTER